VFSTGTVVHPAVGQKGFSVPQSYSPGQEGQIDRYESWADLAGERVKLQVFSMRSMFSSVAFHRGYFRATQQAFLEAHELGFAYFGGVFRTLRYDNLKVAVKKILRGYRREETEKFIAFRSHCGLPASFGIPRKAMKKVVWKERSITSGTTIRCPCRKLLVWTL